MLYSPLGGEGAVLKLTEEGKSKFIVPFSVYQVANTSEKSGREVFPFRVPLIKGVKRSPKSDSKNDTY